MPNSDALRAVIGWQRAARPCMAANTVGTKTSVATVANSRPPITARPSGAFCSPPSPMPKRHGQHADDHRQRGHQHRAEAGEARIERRLQRVAPSFMRSRAKLTTRMLLAVATPMHMMAPVRAGTLSVVPVMQQHPGNAGHGGGQCGDDDEGIGPGLEVDDDQQVHQHDRADHADRQPRVGGVMVCTWPRSTMCVPLGSLPSNFGDLRADVVVDGAEVAILRGAVRCR